MFGAPAGWYPDPLGLPQLRWWNNHAWTEQTSAARQPMVMQDTKFAWADDELPTRREERERERQRDERKPAEPVKPTAATLRELEPPRAFTKINDTPAPRDEAHDPYEPQQTSFTETPRTEYAAQGDHSTQTGYANPAGYGEPLRPTPSFDSLFDNAPAGGTAADESIDSIFGTRAEARRTEGRPSGRRSTLNVPTESAMRDGGPMVSTAPSWIIAMIPLFQLVLSLLLLTALGMGSNVVVFAAILVVPYFIVIGLAFADSRMLRARGIERPAHWAWAFLSAPIYLLARARNVIRESGHGIAPVLVWFGLGTLHLVSVVAIPGLIIAILPNIFVSQLEASVESDALLISGASMSVTCPVAPPVLFGEQTVCQAVSASGKNSDISVSLERSNGWIAWQVLDWGVWGIDR
nr:DUF2510 domain-containing protein [Conyzicola lurida]